MIYFRALTIEDAPQTITFRKDKEIQELYLGNIYPNSLALEKNWIERLPGLEPYTVTFGIENDKKELVGFFQLKNIDYINGHGEFSILIGAEYQGKAYGKLTTKQAIDYAFNTLNLRKLYLYVLSLNTRAIQLYDGLMFKKSGVLKQHVFRNGEYHDLIIMELIR